MEIPDGQIEFALATKSVSVQLDLISIDGRRFVGQIRQRTNIAGQSCQLATRIVQQLMGDPLVSLGNSSSAQAFGEVFRVITAPVGLSRQ